MYVLAFITAAPMLTLPASAQDKKEKQDKEQIIIRKKGDKNEKTTIVIEGDKVTVNGKPVTKEDKDVIIQRFNEDDAYIMRLPKMPRMKVNPGMRYRYDGPEGWQNEDFMKDFTFEMKSGAFLGVITNKNEKGAEISEVQKETAAEKAGLKKGDIIIKADNKKIDSPDDLVEAIRARKPNDEVTIICLRDGKEKKVKVKLGESKFPGETFQKNFEFKQDLFKKNQEMFKEQQLNFERMQPFMNGQFEREFMQIHNRPQLGATIQDTEEGNGVKVLEVEADSPAAKNGLQKDDIITEINGKKVTNVSEARASLHEKNEKNTWSLQVLRAGSPVNIDIKIPKKLNKADL